MTTQRDDARLKIFRWIGAIALGMSLAASGMAWWSGEPHGAAYVVSAVASICLLVPILLRLNDWRGYSVMTIGAVLTILQWTWWH